MSKYRQGILGKFEPGDDFLSEVAKMLPGSGSNFSKTRHLKGVRGYNCSDFGNFGQIRVYQIFSFPIA